MKRRMSMALAGLLLAVPAFMSAAEDNRRLTIADDVRHELVMLPWFSVFDNLEYQVVGGNVILSGQVIRPTLKTSAENVVKRIEGVEQVTNNIEVLPLSPFDDRIRLAAYRAIYGYGPLQRYGLNPQAPIRIIVRNGHITLEGIVANEMDRNLANMRANQVSGVFSVTNDLRVENRG